MDVLTLKDEWKFVITIDGALSVMTHGLLMMPMWHVDNLDSVAQASYWHHHINWHASQITYNIAFA